MPLTRVERWILYGNVLELLFCANSAEKRILVVLPLLVIENETTKYGNAGDTGNLRLFSRCITTYDTRPAILPATINVDGPRTSERDETTKLSYSVFLATTIIRSEFTWYKVNVQTNGLHYSTVRMTSVIARRTRSSKRIGLMVFCPAGKKKSKKENRVKRISTARNDPTRTGRREPSEKYDTV